MFDKVHWLIHCQFRMVLLLASYFSVYDSPCMPGTFYTYRISASWILVGWLNEDCRVWDTEVKLLPHLQQKGGTWAPRDKRLLSCIRPEVLKADLETPRSNWDPFRNMTRSPIMTVPTHHWPFSIPIPSWSHGGIFLKLQLTCNELLNLMAEGMSACIVLRLQHFFLFLM